MATTRKPKIETRDVGVPLRAAHWAPEENAGKRPLVFFNGIGANLELVFKLGDMMTDRDVLAFDAPGIGGSPAPTLPYRPWQLSRWVKRLAESYGFDEIDVMGVSWGGGLAQQFAFQYRNSVQRVVLAATSTGWTMVPGKMEALSKMADPRRYAEPDFMRKNFQSLYGDELDDSGMGHTQALTPPTTRGYAYQMIAMAGWTSLPFLRFMRQPILVMMGDRDNIVPLVNGKMISAVAPNGRLHVVEDGGHLFLVTKADDVFPVVNDFLDEDLAEAAMAAAQ
ncbi:MAG: alpha/beta fold hydrolase [Pseudomonadota bacterium]